MRIYEIDYQRLPGILIPVALRKPRMLAWLQSLTRPWLDLHGLFRAYRERALYKIEHTPQVFSMEKVLNDAFDRAQRRIYIPCQTVRCRLSATKSAVTSPVLVEVAKNTSNVMAGLVNAPALVV